VTYKERLQKSALEVGNIACMGLDPILEALPSETPTLKMFYHTLFTAMKEKGLMPAAFKPNVGYYSALDNPKEGQFAGSVALNSTLELLNTYFPTIPVIFDSKRGDIARSSENYAIEAFVNYRCDAVTASAYMGFDSVSPFDAIAPSEKGIYLLVRTSNPGGSDIQNLLLHDNRPLYMAVAQKVVQWSSSFDGVGAVVGATEQKELRSLASYFGTHHIPLLIPGVGSQGASARLTVEILAKEGYPLYLGRINSSSNLTHPWKKGGVPSSWLTTCLQNIEQLLQECAL